MCSSAPGHRRREASSPGRHCRCIGHLGWLRRRFVAYSLSALCFTNAQPCGRNRAALRDWCHLASTELHGRGREPPATGERLLGDAGLPRAGWRESGPTTVPDGGSGRSTSLDLSAQKGSATKSLTVRGHAALLESLPPDGTPDFPAPTYYLQWVERPGLTLTIAATFGATASDVQRMAAGLVVHSVPDSPGTQDEAEIRQAFADAYTGGTPDATILGAIEDGQSLAPVLADFKKRQPQMARTARVSVGQVVFRDDTHADVTYSLTFERPGSTALSGGQEAVKVGDHWKVTQHGFCLLIAITGIACPAS